MAATRRAVLVDPVNGAQLVADHPVPTPGPGEALIRVTRAGICNTDLEIIKGYSGFKGVLGHEFLGHVVKTNSDDVTSKGQVTSGAKVKVGERVVGEINLACGDCPVCEEGGVPARNHCPRRTVLGIQQKDGGFAEYVTLPVVNLHRVPDSLPDDRAVFAEPLAAAFRIVEQQPYVQGDAVAIIGDGKLGNCCAQVFTMEAEKYNFRRLCIFGKHMEKMELAPPGVERHLVTSDTGVKFKDAFDVVVEACGAPSGLVMAADITRPLGTVVLKTTCAAGTSEFNTAPFVVKEIKIVGSRCGNFPMALESMASGKIDLTKMIEKVYPFEEAMAAIEHTGRRGAMKIQMTFN